MREVFARGALVAAMLLAACGDPAARLTLVPIDLPSDDPSNPCGKPAASAVHTTEVIAYTPSQELTRTDSEISDFPADTEQLGIELFGAGGAVLAEGKTAPLDYGALADGTQIPIAVLPPAGFCRTNDMTRARAHPIVARAGDGVLVLGGGSDVSAEYYDPGTASFTAIELPGQITDLDGLSAATLADGRVALTGAQALTVFDPKTQVFSSPSFIDDRRIGHASIGLDASHVLVTGGCLSSSGSCDATATALRTSLVYEIGADGAIVGDGVGEPALPPSSVRYGAALFDVGELSDGSRRLVVAGATSDPTTADQIPIGGSGVSTTAAGMHAQVAALDGGALLAAFELDGSPQTGAASILAPEAGGAQPSAFAPAWDGSRLVVAEDGTALAIGGDPRVATYAPTTNSWSTNMPAGDTPGATAGPALVRLADGSVLVLGGEPATAHAWLFRPSLVGPSSGQVFGLPDGSQGVLTPTTRATATLGSPITLAAPADDLSARLLVGGPRMTTGSVRASLTVASGGVALIAQQTAPGAALVARLVPGDGTRIERHVGATVTKLCSGTEVSADQLATGVTFTVTEVTATVTVGSTAPTTIISCDLTADPAQPASGQWGIAATANGMIQVSAVTVARAQ